MTRAHTYQPPHLIDTAPLALQYEVMTRTIHGFIAAGHMALVLRYSQKLLRLIRVYNRLTGANVLARRKRDMLRNSAWRNRVLRDLGGRERLRRWDEIRARFMPRLETKSAASLHGAYYNNSADETPSWLRTPGRIAESERLKARARDILRANAHPNIVRGRVKTDFDGLFRLPPLPRKSRLPANIKIYTQHTISDYDWNPIPFAKEDGFGSATVWPQEFYAAMGMEAVDSSALSSVIPNKERRDDNPGPNVKNGSEGLGPACAGYALLRDDKIEEMPLLHPKNILSSKDWNDIFEDPV